MNRISVLSGFLSPLVSVVAWVIGAGRMPKTAAAKAEDPAALMRGLSSKTRVRVVSTDARFAVLDREGRTQEAWRTALRALLTAESYRGVTRSRSRMRRMRTWRLARASRPKGLRSGCVWC